MWILLKKVYKLYKLSSRELFIYYFHDVIGLINNETIRTLTNPKIQVIMDIYFLEFNLKRFFKDSS